MLAALDGGLQDDEDTIVALQSLVGTMLSWSEDWLPPGDNIGLLRPGLRRLLDDLCGLDLQFPLLQPILGLRNQCLHLGADPGCELIKLFHLLTGGFCGLLVVTVHGFPEFEQEPVAARPQLPELATAGDEPACSPSTRCHRSDREACPGTNRVKGTAG